MTNLTSVPGPVRRFSDTLLDHARHPHNMGRDPQANAQGRADFNGRPPNVEFYLRVDGSQVSAAKFHAVGCGVTIAAASLLTDLVRGRRLDECRAITPEHVAQNLDGIPADKRLSIEVVMAALRNALDDADQRMSDPGGGNGS